MVAKASRPPSESGKRLTLAATCLAVLAVVAVAPWGVVHAQTRPSQPDLVFPTQANELGFFSPWRWGSGSRRATGRFRR